MQISYSSLELKGTTIENSKFRAIYASNADQIKIEDSVFDRMDQNFDGGVIYSQSTSDMEIKDSTFVDNKASSSKGGAIYIDGSYNQDYVIKNCNFTNNIAASGGAVYTYKKLTINDTHFENNQAYNYTSEDDEILGGYGGALYFNCDGDDCVGLFARNNFTNNVAVKEGGAIKARSNYPTLDDNNFSGN